jgi:hypothetical protein
VIGEGSSGSSKRCHQLPLPRSVFNTDLLPSDTPAKLNLRERTLDRWDLIGDRVVE